MRNIQIFGFTSPAFESWLWLCSRIYIKFSGEKFLLGPNSTQCRRFFWWTREIPVCSFGWASAILELINDERFFAAIFVFLIFARKKNRTSSKASWATRTYWAVSANECLLRRNAQIALFGLLGGILPSLLSWTSVQLSQETFFLFQWQPHNETFAGYRSLDRESRILNNAFS